MFGAFDVSSSALNAQRVRLETISSNIAGFDATAGSQLRAVPAADGSLQATPNAARVVTESVFLPLYPELTEPAIDRLADVLISQRHQ